MLLLLLLLLFSRVASMFTLDFNVTSVPSSSSTVTSSSPVRHLPGLPCTFGGIPRRAPPNLLLTLECSGRRIRTLGVFDSPSLPSGLQVLDLSKNKLSKFSPIFLSERLPHLEELDLSNNLVHKIRDGGDISWASLRILNLSGNLLTRLRKDDLKFARNVQYLDLSGNNLMNLERSVFSGCHMLLELNLRDNRLSLVKGNWFWGLWKLRHLYLSRNGIHHLNNNTASFSHLHALRTLDLGGNRLRYLHSTTLEDTGLLENLNFRGNRFQEFPLKALRKLRHLKLADFSGNRFKFLRRQSISNLTLRELKMNALANLVMVDSSAFSGLQNLQRLEMRGNSKLLFISAQAFRSLPSLRVLDVSRNVRMKVAPVSDWMSSAHTLLTVYLYGCTSLVCTCTTGPASVAAATVPIHVKNGTITTCTDNRGEVTPILRSTDRSVCLSTPVILPIFPSHVSIPEGHALRLPCRVYPSRGAHLRWHLPQLPSSLKRQHIKQLANGDLVLRDAVRALSARYACSATFRNGGRSPIAYVTVKVVEMKARIIITHIGSTSITVTWYKLTNLNRYVILYKPARSTTDLSHDFRHIELMPYMHSYTINDLTSEKQYQLCIGMKTYLSYEHLHCTLVVTKSYYDEETDIFNSGKIIVILISIIGVSLGILVACLICCSVKRDSKQDHGENWSQASLAGGSSLSDTTPMTFENRAIEDFDDEEEDPDDEELDEEAALEESFFHQSPAVSGVSNNARSVAIGTSPDRQGQQMRSLSSDQIAVKCNCRLSHSANQMKTDCDVTVVDTQMDSPV